MLNIAYVYKIRKDVLIANKFIDALRNLSG